MQKSLAKSFCASENSHSEKQVIEGLKTLHTSICRERTSVLLGKFASQDFRSTKEMFLKANQLLMVDKAITINST